MLEKSQISAIKDEEAAASTKLLHAKLFLASLYSDVSCLRRRRKSVLDCTKANKMNRKVTSSS